MYELTRSWRWRTLGGPRPAGARRPAPAQPGHSRRSGPGLRAAVRIRGQPGRLGGRSPAVGEGMLAMAEANGEVALRDPDQLVKEIERTRENLARTIDTLTERVSPANLAKRAMSQVRDQVSRPEVQIGAAALAVVTLALLVWRRRGG